eukprot:1126126-Pyramimonas_sp.AAC.1
MVDCISCGAGPGRSWGLSAFGEMENLRALVAPAASRGFRARSTLLRGAFGASASWGGQRPRGQGLPACQAGDTAQVVRALLAVFLGRHRGRDGRRGPRPDS